MAKSKTVKAPAEEAKIETKVPVLKNLRDGDDTPETDVRPFTLFFGEHTLTVSSVTYTPYIDPETLAHMGDDFFFEFIMTDQNGHSGTGEASISISFQE